MSQSVLENEKEELNCEFCTGTFKSRTGLQYHIHKKHTLDTSSGLTCYTCNKIFTKRDLIENHFKTVKHQIECKRLLEEDRVEMTSSNYRQNLYKMNNFRYRPYQPKRVNFVQTTLIPLESETDQQDPRRYRQISPQEIEEKVQNSHRSTLNQPSTRSTVRSKHIENEDFHRESANKDTEIQSIGTASKENSHISQEKKKEGQNSNRSEDADILEKSKETGTETNLIVSRADRLSNSTEGPEHVNKMKDTQTEIITGKKNSNSHHTPETNRSETRSTTLKVDQPCETTEEDDIQIYLTEEEEKIFPEIDNLINQLSNIDNEITETRRIYLNNDWQITDTVGNPDFVGLIENNPNIDWLTFISDKLPY